MQGWTSWLADWLKGGAVGLAIAVPLVLLLYGILRRFPRRWWLGFWLATLPVIVFVVFLAPFVIDPLFFRFEPLERRAPEVVSEIGRVTSRAGLPIPGDKMYWMEASEKRNSVNAYVTGLGPSKRVVVWDTTLAKMTPPQTLFVFGHEMGHYVLGHVPKTILFVGGAPSHPALPRQRGSTPALREWSGALRHPLAFGLGVDAPAPSLPRGREASSPFPS